MDKKAIKRHYDMVWSLPRGTETTCPMCRKVFVKRQGKQGCCSKNPCGNAYTKMFRPSRARGQGFQSPPTVEASGILSVKWGIL